MLFIQVKSLLLYCLAPIQCEFYNSNTLFTIASICFDIAGLSI